VTVSMEIEECLKSTLRMYFEGGGNKA
jgi:hypothetical protein